jgi:hypothetical protein
MSTVRPDADSQRELSESDVAELERQWAAIEAGQPTVPHERVVLWLRTWGSPAFRAWQDG